MIQLALRLRPSPGWQNRRVKAVLSGPMLARSGVAVHLIHLWPSTCGLLAVHLLIRHQNQHPGRVTTTTSPPTADTTAGLQPAAADNGAGKTALNACPGTSGSGHGTGAYSTLSRVSRPHPLRTAAGHRDILRVPHEQHQWVAGGTWFCTMSRFNFRFAGHSFCTWTPKMSRSSSDLGGGQYPSLLSVFRLFWSVLAVVIFRTGSLSSARSPRSSPIA